MTAAPRAEWLTISRVCADLQVSEAEWNAWRQAGDTPLHVVMPSGQLRIRAADYARWLDSRTIDASAEEVTQARTPARTRTDPYAYGTGPAQNAHPGNPRTRAEAAPAVSPHACGNPKASRPSATNATPAPLRPLPAYWRQRIRDAIDATGDRGFGRAEIWALTRRCFTLRQINEALAELLASEAYEEIIARTGNGRPPVRYRRRKPSRTAGSDASHAARADASPRAGRDASNADPRDASRSTTARRDGLR